MPCPSRRFRPKATQRCLLQRDETLVTDPDREAYRVLPTPAGHAVIEAQLGEVDDDTAGRLPHALLTGSAGDDFGPSLS